MERKVLFQCCECGEPIRDGSVYYKITRKPYTIAVCKDCCKFEIADAGESRVNFSDIATNF